MDRGACQATVKAHVLCCSHILQPLKVFQSLSHARLFETPWTTACQAPLSTTISWSLLKFMSIELVMLTMSSPSPLAIYLSQHQGMLVWINKGGWILGGGQEPMRQWDQATWDGPSLVTEKWVGNAAPLHPCCWPGSALYCVQESPELSR